MTLKLLTRKINKYVQGGKNATQVKANNFFVICSLHLQFTHIASQCVTFVYLKGFFRQMKCKKVISEKQNDQFIKFVIFFETSVVLR